MALACVCLTGAVAALSHEIEWLFCPRKRASPSDSPSSFGARWDAARAALPGARWQSISRTGTESDREQYLATLVHGTEPDGGAVTAYVDPADARVVGLVRGVTFPSFMRALHYYLFDPSSWNLGFYVLALLGPVLLASALSGLFVYGRWWRGFLRRPDPKAKPRAWWGQLHRLAGLWSLPFALAIGVTVVWYLVEWDDWVDWNQWGHEIKTAGSLRWDRPTTGADIDRWISTALREIPDLRVSGVSLPYEPGGAVSVTGQASAILVRERSNEVLIDPASGAVLHRSLAHEMPATERWTHTADPLHFGGFGGLGTKLLWSAWGLLLAGLSASGAVVCARRLALRETGDAPTARVLRIVVGTAALFVAVPSICYWSWKRHSAPPARTVLGTIEAAGLRLSLSREGPEEADPQTWIATFDDGDLPRIAGLDLAYGGHEPPSTWPPASWSVARGFHGELSPPALSPHTRLWIRLRTSDGLETLGSRPLPGPRPAPR
jgi:uncharacterized iron-regulated membrane protein